MEVVVSLETFMGGSLRRAWGNNMISNGLKKNYEDVSRLFSSLDGELKQKIWKKKEIEEYMRQNGVEPDTFFLPSDICYNHTTKPLGDTDDSFEKSVHVFEYVGRNRYRVLGTGYPYTGLVMRKRSSDRKELVVGEWFNGHIIKWDKNMQLDLEDLKKDLQQEAIEISHKIDELNLIGKEKESIVKTRVNQGVFRERLLRRYSQCCLCGVSCKDVLIASHIKPWSECEADEKLDVNNGLLLCPNHDSLFDKKLISFDDDGQILISEKLDERNRTFLNIREGMHIEICDENRKYLNYHRERFFD